MTDVGFLPNGYAPEVDRVRVGEMSFAVLEAREAKGLHETYSHTFRATCPWCGHMIYDLHDCGDTTDCGMCDGQVMLFGHRTMDPTPIRATRGARLPAMFCVEDDNDDIGFDDAAWRAMAWVLPCSGGLGRCDIAACSEASETSAWRRCSR